MNKHTITIDANDIPRGEGLATKIMEEVFEMKIDLSDLDVLFNKIKDMGNGICIIIKNAGLPWNLQIVGRMSRFRREWPG